MNASYQAMVDALDGRDVYGAGWRKMLSLTREIASSP